jgi:folate-binding protein YgfZ
MFSADAYQAARERAASLDRADRGRIVVSGADRASYLQGLLTNDVTALEAGQGCYAAYLTAQGRMIADLFVYELGDVILLTVPLEQTPTVLEKLDQFVFSEDVQLGDATGAFTTTAIVGPDSPRIVSSLTGIAELDLAAWPDHGNRRGRVGDRAVIVTRVTDAGEPGFDLHVEAAGGAWLRQRLEEAGVPALTAETSEALRIEAGVPRFNRDMDQETIPLEAGIESRAISFSKGCYVGQEVIIRVLHRGHGRVARKLVGLLGDTAAPPSAGVAVMADGRDVGHVTSGAWSGALHRSIALAYLHRDFLTPGTAVSFDGRPAAVHQLPFVPARPA